VIWDNPLLSLNDIQYMINSMLERQVKSNNELMHRLIEERDGKKLVDSNVNPSYSSCAINLTQPNPQTSGTSASGTTMPNLLAQSMNHFHSWTTIDGLTPTFGMPQQITARMFRQGYMHTAPSFSMPNLGSTPYTLGANSRAYANTNNNYHAPYSIIAYTDPIPLLGSSAGFLLNHHAFHNVMQYNTYDQPKNGSFGYETLPQFPFRPQRIDMTSARATTEPCVDPNNITNQLAMILWESFSIEPKGRGCVYQKPYPDTMTNSLTPEVIEFLSSQSLVGRMVKPH
jgi:hypothetical protein